MRPSSIFLVAFALGGCGSQLAQVRAENRRLTTQVEDLRLEARSDKRTIQDLHNQVFVLRDKLETSSVQQGKVGTDVPRLPVKVVGPSATADDLGPSDLEPGARIVARGDDGSEIVYAGDAASGKVAAVAELTGDITTPDDDPPAPRPRARAAPVPRGVDDADVPRSDDRLGTIRDIPKVSTVAARTAPRAPRDTSLPSPGGPIATYESAVAALKVHDHATAVSGLREFVRRWPEHDYADNAQYWLGEAYYDQKDYKTAAAEFRRTIERYPGGNKVPDALLKLGYSYQALGQLEQARATLEQVVSIYPRSGPAKLAAERLAAIAK
ncbi:MAG: tol-pal system protein YbgF [Deltaproteobacteria bacterium]|nr:tol-pal system protein YbgF [Deltaproteobacteria bacterium]